jgi:protein CpxP
MKNLKSIIVLAGLAIAVSGNAQEKQKKSVGTPEEEAKKKTEKMTKEFGLSKEQEKKVYDLNLEREKERAQIKKEMDALKERRKANMKKFDAGMKTTLNAEQNKKYEEMKKQRMQKSQQQSRGQGTGSKQQVKPIPKERQSK